MPPNPKSLRNSVNVILLILSLRYRPRPRAVSVKAVRMNWSNTSHLAIEIEPVKGEPTPSMTI